MVNFTLLIWYMEIKKMKITKESAEYKIIQEIVDDYILDGVKSSDITDYIIEEKEKSNGEGYQDGLADGVYSSVKDN